MKKIESPSSTPPLYYASRNDEVAREVAAIRRAGRRALRSRESAIAFLQEAGILDERGELAEPYRR